MVWWYMLSTQEAETGGLEVQGCLCLQSNEASLRHMRPCLKKSKKNEVEEKKEDEEEREEEEGEET